MVFFKDLKKLLGFFSCFLLSKIAYNQRKAKNRLMNYLQGEKTLKRFFSILSNHSKTSPLL
ncbi:hypothetical protein X567_07650 [Helicobacter pylori PMSS1]|nr:hypothetical protein X567_07650 [Helicobacter pylori PMSS1]